MRFTSRGFPSPQRMGFASRESPSPKRMGFSSRGFPYPMRMRVASRGFLLSNANGIRFEGVPLSKANNFCFQGFPLSTATVFRFNVPAWSRHQHSSCASSENNPFCGLLLPSIFPSKGDKEADESSLTAQVKAMIIFYPQELPGCPEVTLPSFVEIFRGVTDAAIPSGSLLA